MCGLSSCTSAAAAARDFVNWAGQCMGSSLASKYSTTADGATYSPASAVARPNGRPGCDMLLASGCSTIAWGSPQGFAFELQYHSHPGVRISFMPVQEKDDTFPFRALYLR